MQRRYHPITSVLAASVVALLAAVAGAQNAPPGVSDGAAPKLGTLKDFGLFGGPVGGGSNHVALSGSFMVEKGSRNGILTLTADIDPSWHVYGIDQPKGGPQKSEIQVTK